MPKIMTIKLSIVFIALMSIPIICHGQETFDFRHCHWGDSKDEVKQSENGKTVLDESDSVLLIADTLNGLKCSVFYLFVDDKLVRSRYTIEEKYSNTYIYIVKYEDLYNLLSTKYGKGKKSQTMFEPYKSNPVNLGNGIALGKVHFLSSWKTKNSDISLLLTGNNFDITLAIEYTSIELAPLEAAQKQKKVLDKL